MGVQTFWLEPTDQVAVGLRRYKSSEGGGFDCPHGYHSALAYTGVEPASFRDTEYSRRVLEIRPEAPHDDNRWPTTCEHCDYAFTPDDHWQDWQELIWRRTDTGELRVLHTNAPADSIGVPAAEVGACWDAYWIPENWRKNPDGIYLMVRLPDLHDWAVDSRASNCGSPDDDVHQCWVRHGDPRECKVTVDKNGNTCSAGAGSIASPNWHGFLRGGQLVA